MSGRIKHQEIFVALRKAGLTDRFEYRSPIEYDSSRRLEQFVEIIAAKAAAAEREECAAEIEALRNANEAFARRQEWWNDRMVELEAAVLAEREECAKLVENCLSEVTLGIYGDASLAKDVAAEIRARGKE